MNQLSWLLYLSEVSESARGMAGVVGGIGLLGGIVAAAFSVPVGLVLSDMDIDLRPFLKKAIGPVATACVVAGLVWVFVPSKGTLMLIAASEVGETVLASKDVQDIGGEAGALATDSLKLLRKYVTEQLAGADAK